MNRTLIFVHERLSLDSDDSENVKVREAEVRADINLSLYGGE